MSGVGKAYGQALYSLAQEEFLSECVLEQLQILDQAFIEEPGFLRLLSAPNIPVAERCDILDRCFRGKVTSYVLNMLKLMTEKSAIMAFHDSVKAYTQLYYEDHNIMPVTAVTAIALNPDQINRLTQKLSEITGKNALLHNRVDASCLGGVRLHYDGKCVDGSVANRLDMIRKQLKNTVL